jgi:geranylgeranylglycerol-phosphate geranylgeranyltransferase
MPAIDFFKMLRPLNCTMAAFGAFVGYSLASHAIQGGNGVGFAMLAAFIICGAGMAINDYFDRETDKRLHPNKPIPSGRIPPKTALAFSLVLFALGNAVAIAFLPLASVAIAIAFTFLLMAYSAFLTRAKYLGNFVVASGTAFTLIFGASVLGNYAVAAVLALAALFANLARELIKDLEDLEADRGHKKTLPMIVGIGPVNALVFAYYLLAIILVYVPVVLMAPGLGPLFAAVVSIANFVFLYSFGETLKHDYARAQALAKGAMFIALLGFLLGVV